MGQVVTFEISPDGGILLVGSTKGAYVYDIDTLEHLYSLGEYSNIKTLWGSWAMGPSSNDHKDNQQCLLVAIPALHG